ncbi:MAG TPA: DUF4260 family protein, partial [Candidatus Saccharimonadia bacterium]|nr:DUF4260 family protein [Candidatus Saccharimonadia bacterium]
CFDVLAENHQLILGDICFSHTTLSVAGRVNKCRFCFERAIGLDRALGYGLKFASSFNETHLGHIGNPKSA